MLKGSSFKIGGAKFLWLFCLRLKIKGVTKKMIMYTIMSSFVDSFNRCDVFLLQMLKIEIKKTRGLVLHVQTWK